MIDRPVAGCHGSHRRRERGSAFIVALLVLLVMTVAGLALTLMTQTEVRIGANEREANRTFYASDSGIHVSSARTLWAGTNTQTLTVLLNTTQQDTGASSAPPLTFADQITVTPLYPLYAGSASGTSINQNQQTAYAAVTHVVNATSQRAGKLGSTTQNMAQKLVGSMIELQPWAKANSLFYHPQTVTGLRY
ncbi:MAG TPA: pilus assembly PilX N-terminal domain-containing protein [Thermoanaerobaculia bacterium]